MLTALVHALKHQLRLTNPDADMERLLANSYDEKLQTAVFKPIIILKNLGLWINKAKRDGRLDSITQVAFDENLNKLSDIIGGCERIASTPIPYTYNILLHRTVYIYCFLLPFGFGESMLWTLPFVIVFIAYTFVALEAIADELEDPFGIEPNDLALDAMSAMIENTLAEIDNKRIEPIEKPKYFYIT
jgi:putative membrane protein